jgi:GNAT superfamily N-acetyltransferase
MLERVRDFVTGAHRRGFVNFVAARYRRTMNVAPLERAQLAEAELVLADACPFDRATEVADEKLFAPGPTAAVHAFGAWQGNELIGVAAVSARWLRLLAVVPRARRAGAGSALLDACEAVARGEGTRTLSALDQPGNYLAPGIDERNPDAIAWLERRGWRRSGEPRTNVLLAVRDNPRVSGARAAEFAARAAAKGYEVRRARPDEREPLCAAIAAEFGGAWPFEIERALGYQPAGVHVAIKDGAYCAFAAHDGNNQGLGWFGPTGTWPAHRGKGLGEALLMACLVDVAAERAYCEVAWIGPRPFYENVAGIAGERRFIPLAKDLA